MPIRIHFDIPWYHKVIFSWYNEFGRKNLPWQRNLDPYSVWISEIMLQQTQVNAVIPYFLKFMIKFPTIESIAYSNQDIVMSNWAGLGYYARARNIYKSAVMIMEKYNGIFPDSFNELIKLPGIGRSTANAILSISFQQSTPIMDTIVRRVLCRLFALSFSFKKKGMKKKFGILHIS